MPLEPLELRPPLPALRRACCVLAAGVAATFVAPPSTRAADAGDTVAPDVASMPKTTPDAPRTTVVDKLAVDEDRLAQRRRRRRRRAAPEPEATEEGDEAADGEDAEDDESPDGGTGEEGEVRGRVDDAAPNLELAAAAAGEGGEGSDPDRAVQPGSGNLRRSNVMEFDARLVRGETAGSGAVVLFDRGQRPLPPLTRRRKRFLEPTLAIVAAPADLEVPSPAPGDDAEDEREPASADADADEATAEPEEAQEERRERRRRRRRRRPRNR